ncbi:MAG: hypothetical protein RMJ19_12245, partial [Gemmatales bacterium]|nr:hypothetical protein [Gemmatales bacterium]MDW8176436.1 hypothetical protein [Gemmatales bacterium]
NLSIAPLAKPLKLRQQLRASSNKAGSEIAGRSANIAALAIIKESPPIVHPHDLETVPMTSIAHLQHRGPSPH